MAHKRRTASVSEVASGSAGHAYDWRTMRAAPPYPDRRALRMQWNAEKGRRCVSADTGEVWWPQNSKEAYSNGIFDACDAFDRWARSCAEGGKVGFPKFKKRGGDCDRYRISTGALRLDGRRRVVIPRIGRVRTHENMRSLARLVEKGPEHAKIRSATIRRRGTRIEIVFAVDVARPQSMNQAAEPDSVVGVDVGVRCLATVANDSGEVIARHDNPRALDRVLDEIRDVSRGRSRCEGGSLRYRELTRELGALHARAHNIRTNCLHLITTDLAKSHGTIVVEGAVWSALAQQKHLPGARTRRRQLHDAALGQSGDNSATRPAGTGLSWSSPTSSIRRRRHAPHAGTSKTSDGPPSGRAPNATHATTATMPPRSISLHTRSETTLHAVSADADGAQLGLRSSGVQKQDPNPPPPPTGAPGRELGTSPRRLQHQMLKGSPEAGTRRGGPAVKDTRTKGHPNQRGPLEPRDGVHKSKRQQTPRFRVTEARSVNTRVAQQIIMGYIRAIQKARSNALEACGESRSLAADLDSVLFSEDTDRLLEALAAAADHPSPTDPMNLSYMMRKARDGSPSLQITALAQIDRRLDFIDNPPDALKAVVS